MRTMRMIAAVALAATVGMLVAWEASAADGAAADLFRDFGLFGTWAVVCGQPASVDNPHVTVALLAGGAVIEDHVLGGAGMANHYRVLAARRLSDTRIAVEVILNPDSEFQERQKLIMVVRGDTRRTVFNKSVQGEVHVKDGLALGFGIRTPLLKKCG